MTAGSTWTRSWPRSSNCIRPSSRWRPGQRLVDRDPDLGAGSELAADEVLFENGACEGGHRLSIARGPPLGPDAPEPPGPSSPPPSGRSEILVRRDGPLPLLSPPDRAPISKRLMHGQVETLLALFRLGAVERALPAGGRQAAARGALPGLVLARCPDTSSTSTRASEAASSVSAQPEAARPPRPAPSRQRSTSSASSLARACSRIGLVSSSSSFGDACASAVVQPTSAPFVAAGSTSSIAARVSSSETMITFGSVIRLTRRSISPATSRRCSATSFSMCRWNRACDQPP